MKKLIFVIFLLAGIHLIGTAQDSKTKVEGSDYKKKVENKGTHHTAMYGQGSTSGHVAHHYRRHSTGHRHIAYRRHVYHKHIVHNRKHVYSKPVAHHKKIKEDNKKGEYKVKT
jgi:hypothetical protein